MAKEKEQKIGDVKGEALKVSAIPMLPAAQAEIDSLIATAKKFPRSVTVFQAEVLSLATCTKEIAAACFYVLPRAGNVIEGPSVRLAEIALSAWGNAMVQGEITGQDASFVYATGTCRDLEKNVAFRITTRRRITDKNGKRYNDDMIMVTGNAACSIALRNAIFKVVPAAFIQEVLQSVKQVAVGDIKSLSAEREKAFLFLIKMGTTKERILHALGNGRTPNKPLGSIQDVNLTDMQHLLGFANAIQQDNMDIEEVFPPTPKERKAGPGKAGKQAEGTATKIGDVLPAQPTKAPAEAPAEAPTEPEAPAEQLDFDHTTNLPAEKPDAAFAAKRDEQKTKLFDTGKD